MGTPKKRLHKNEEYLSLRIIRGSHYRGMRLRLEAQKGCGDRKKSSARWSRDAKTTMKLKEEKMRSKWVPIICLSLFTMLFLSGSLFAEQKTIKVGAVYPLTGNIASTGLDCKRGAELAVDIINGKYDLSLPLAKAEGLPNLGG